MNKIIYIGIFSFTFIWSNNFDFINEELLFTAGFRYLPAGHAKLFFSVDSLNGEALYKLTTSIESNSFLDKFYIIRDEIQSWLKLENLSLIKTIQKIREGNYKKNYEVLIKGDSLAISNNKIRKIPGEVYDPIAFVYYLRKQNLKIGDSYNFFSYSKKKIKEIVVSITALETIQVSAGTFNCLKIEPNSKKNSPILKNEGKLKVWLSNDSLKLPIMIEQETNIGTMVMKLKKVNNK